MEKATINYCGVEIELELTDEGVKSRINFNQPGFKESIQKAFLNEAPEPLREIIDFAYIKYSEKLKNLPQ